MYTHNDYTVILYTVIQEKQISLGEMSLVGKSMMIFNKYTTLYDHLVTAMLREHTEEKHSQYL